MALELVMDTNSLSLAREGTNTASWLILNSYIGYLFSKGNQGVTSVDISCDSFGFQQSGPLEFRICEKK